MLADHFGKLLRSARVYRGLSRIELARRGKVSLRLVAELEQGKRPNVSLESALTLLRAAGVSVVARAPQGETIEIRDSAAEELERAERAEERQRTWTGRQVHLHASGDEPPPERSREKRMAAVAKISRQAYAVAAAGQSGRQGKSKSRSPAS